MTNRPPRILLVCIEFAQPLFSGNGVLTQNIVWGLLMLGYKVTVICALPLSHRSSPTGDGNGNTTGSSSKGRALTLNKYIDDSNLLQIRVIHVPDEYWKRLDRQSCWEIIAKEAPNMLLSDGGDGNNGGNGGDALGLPDHDHAHDHVFAIDWSALPAIYNMQNAGILPRTVKLTYFIFRVFTASKELCRSQMDYNFYLEHEMRGIQRADSVILLSHVDQHAILKQIDSMNMKTNTNMQKLSSTCTRSGREEIISKMHILVPPLRKDIQSLAMNTKSNIASTGSVSNTELQVEGFMYILCNARLSPEKNALRFAQVMQALSQNGTLERLNLIPLMIGSICDENYAQEVYRLLPSNSIIINHFLSSIDMSVHLKKTLLNVHPSIYDAYGMTIPEAAAFGVPSILHHESIGATSLLRDDHDEVFLGDMSSVDSAIQSVEEMLLGGLDIMQAVGRNARKRALSWGVVDYTNSLRDKLV